MYPAHRLQVLAEVMKRLGEQQPCFLVSTQCIEAGVDVDFPAVWRAFGPYDSMVQAAGRCNRNGALKDDAGRSILGQVQVFLPADAAAPKGIYASAMQTADLLRKMGKAKPDVPASFETYFRLLYQATVPDLGGCAVQSAREKLHFEEVSKMFNLIDADSVPLLIPNDGWAKMAAPEGSDSGRTFLPDLKPFHGNRLRATAIRSHPIRSVSRGRPPIRRNLARAPLLEWREAHPPSLHGGDAGSEPRPTPCPAG